MAIFYIVTLVQHVRYPRKWKITVVGIATTVIAAGVQVPCNVAVLLLIKHRRSPVHHGHHVDNALHFLKNEVFCNWTKWRLWCHHPASLPCLIRKHFACIEEIQCSLLCSQYSREAARRGAYYSYSELPKGSYRYGINMLTWLVISFNVVMTN